MILVIALIWVAMEKRNFVICNQGVTSSNLVAGTIYGTNRDRRSRLVQRTLAKHFARIHDALRIKRVLD
jgi:hypothetical protein